MKFPTLTQNQKLIGSFLLSAMGAALSAGIAAVGQDYTAAGLNIPILINVGLLAFMACLGPALYNFIPAHIQQIIVAGKDTEAMLQANLQQAQQTHAALTQTVQALSQTVQAQAVSTPVQQPLARVQGPQPIVFPAVPKPQPQQQQPNPTLTAPQPQYAFPSDFSPTINSVPGTGTYVQPAQYADLHFGDSQLIPTVPPGK